MLRSSRKGLSSTISIDSRRPLSAEDVDSPDYREGVSCPHCVNEIEAERAARLEERRRQVALAEERGEKHIGQKL